MSDVDGLRSALKFYADHRNHRGVGVSNVYNDSGRKARQAVGECPECKGNGYVKSGRVIGDQDGPYDETVSCRACWGSGVEGVR